MRGPLFQIGAQVTCKQVNHAVASGEPLTLKQRIQLWCHMRICEACRNFSKHLASISSGVRSLCESRTTKNSSRAPQQMKELEDAILKKLREKAP